MPELAEDEVERMAKKALSWSCGGCVLMVAIVCAAVVAITWLVTRS